MCDMFAPSAPEHCRGSCNGLGTLLCAHNSMQQHTWTQVHYTCTCKYTTHAYASTLHTFHRHARQQRFTHNMLLNVRPMCMDVFSIAECGAVRPHSVLPVRFQVRSCPAPAPTHTIWMRLCDTIRVTMPLLQPAWHQPEEITPQEITPQGHPAIVLPMNAQAAMRSHLCDGAQQKA
jgi:hypothetical protein